MGKKLEYLELKNNELQLEKDLKNIFDKYFKKEDINEQRIPLVSTTFGEEEIIESIKTLLSTNLTMGKKVKLFEQKWNEYMEKHSNEQLCSVMVNSGSSANLMAFSILMDETVENHLKPGDEVIVPVVTWSTSIFPIVQLGLKPVFVDVDLESITISVNEIEKAISEKTRAIMPVHLLGNPCNMSEILKMANQHDLFVVEDCCEAHGAMFEDKIVGSFGDISTFSFFYSHHITTIEGGMICSKHGDWENLLRSYRAHGWVRDRNDRDVLISRYQDFDPRFLFVSPGYNLRPTEINGAFGIHQIEKLESFISKRIQNHKKFLEIFKPYQSYFYLPNFQNNIRHSSFAFAFIVKENPYFNVKQFKTYLENNNIETRPITGGNLSIQPGFQNLDLRIVGKLRHADYVSKNGFWIGNHPNISESQMFYFEDIVHQFFKQLKIEDF